MDFVHSKEARDIYKNLGPFDHFEHQEIDDDLEATRELTYDFTMRKSRAMYRGQSLIENGKPDGIGFKVYPDETLFEGYFEEG